MDFQSTDSGHFDAGADREVMFCHECEHEWYRNERPDNQGSDNLLCPSCQGEFIEIVELENDPRSTNDDSSMSDLDHHHHLRHYPDTDSDPEEADIDDHIHDFPGGRGFFSRRNIFRSSDDPQHTPGHRPTTNPENGEDIIHRFNEMLQDINGPGLVGRSGPDTLFATGPRHITYQRISGPGFTGGVSSFTITTGGSGGGSRGPARMGGADDPFQSVFQSILGNVGPPSMDRDTDPGDPDEPGRAPDIRNALNQFVANLLNPHAAHGDAVYTQEALDRIITNLMEANPQSNAAAPATDSAIKNLPRKKLNEEMLGPELKGECTICIDEMKLEDEVLVLPCKHWFHEECVVLWLKQHNTCPICRSPIEGEQAGRPAAPEPSASQAGPSTTEPATSSSSGAEQRRWNLRNQREARLGSIRDMAGPSNWRTSSRRDSNSPQRQPAAPSPRVRSPSNSGRRSPPDEQPSRDRGSSGGGPFHWLRRLGGDRRS